MKPIHRIFEKDHRVSVYARSIILNRTTLNINSTTASCASILGGNRNCMFKEALNNVKLTRLIIELAKLIDFNIKFSSLHCLPLRILKSRKYYADVGGPVSEAQHTKHEE